MSGCITVPWGSACACPTLRLGKSIDTEAAELEDLVPKGGVYSRLRLGDGISRLSLSWKSELLVADPPPDDFGVSMFLLEIWDEKDTLWPDPLLPSSLSRSLGADLGCCAAGCFPCGALSDG